MCLYVYVCKYEYIIIKINYTCMYIRVICHCAMNRSCMVYPCLSSIRGARRPRNYGFIATNLQEKPGKIYGKSRYHENPKADRVPGRNDVELMMSVKTEADPFKNTVCVCMWLKMNCFK